MESNKRSAYYQTFWSKPTCLRKGGEGSPRVLKDKLSFNTLSSSPPPPFTSLLFSLNPVSPAPKDFFDFSYFFCFFYLLHSYSSSFSYDVCFSFDFLLFFLNKKTKEEIHKFCSYLSFDFFLCFFPKERK